MLIGVAVFAGLFSIRAYSLALLVFLTALIVLAADFASTLLLPKDFPIDQPHSVGIRRFWHRPTASANTWFVLDPVIFASAYIIIFWVRHVLLLMGYTFNGIRDLFGQVNEIGISLRTMDHAVNALVFVYLVVHLAAGLLPYTPVSRNERIPVIAVAILVAAMHFAIP